MTFSEEHYHARGVTRHREEHGGCCAYDDALDAELGFEILAYLHVESVDPGFAMAARIGKARKAGRR